MWIFRVNEPRLGAIRIREWRRRARHTVGLLVLLLCSAATGLFILDQSNTSFRNKVLTSVWDGLNLVTTLGAFGEFNRPQKIFMLVAMIATSAKALVVTTPDSNNNLAITLAAHTLNASLAIAVPGENPLRRMLFESAGASNVVIANEIIANALVGKLTT
ncbi:hypothetical protein QFZ99_001753 [Paraburkholderia atlantica]|uniref:NAD-binding protein n=1 Tax=Paraburkholderia atlantica TaxID=2654982 RepID=UPI003D1A4CB4